MTTKTNECKPNSLISKIITGICTTVVAILIVWLCASIVDSKVRLSVMERSYEYIQEGITELKASDKDIKNLLRAIEAKLP